MSNAMLLFVSTVSIMRVRVEHIVQEEDEEIRGVAFAFGEELINRVNLSDGHVILLREFIVKA